MKKQIRAALAVLISACSDDPSEDLEKMLDGELTVIVAGDSSDRQGLFREVPVEGSIVRVEKDGLKLEVISNAEGRAVFKDAALVPPVTVHTFGPGQTASTLIGDPRAVQKIYLRQPDEERDPEDPDPPGAYLIVRGDLSFIPLSANDPLRAIELTRSSDRYFASSGVGTESEMIDEAVLVPEGHAFTVVIIAGPGYRVNDSNEAFVRLRTHAGVVEVPALAHEQIFEIDLGSLRAVDRQVRVNAPTPSQPISEVSLSTGLEITPATRSFLSFSLDEVGRCHFNLTNASWRLRRYVGPWEAKLPELPPGFAPLFTEGSRIFVRCARYPGGKAWDDSSPIDATFEQLLEL